MGFHKVRGARSEHPRLGAYEEVLRCAVPSLAPVVFSRHPIHCVNVPADFFVNVVRPAFTNSSGVVYILPETRPLREVVPALSTQDTP